MWHLVLSIITFFGVCLLMLFAHRHDFSELGRYLDKEKERVRRLEERIAALEQKRQS